MSSPLPPLPPLTPLPPLLLEEGEEGEEEGDERKYVYLLRFSNLEDYKMCDRPYVDNVYSNLETLIDKVKYFVNEWHNEYCDCSEGDSFLICKEWKRSWKSIEELEQMIRENEEINRSCYCDYIMYTNDYGQTLWYSRCTIDKS